MLRNISSEDGYALFGSLDDSQKKAVFHCHGPALVVAGPGSGKTTVILGRVWYLISRCQIPPEQILVLTFTKAAARTLQSRLFSFTNQVSVPVSFGTFHSFFYQILKQYGSYKNFNIITTKEKIAILQELDITDEGLCGDILLAFSYRMNHAKTDMAAVMPANISAEEFEQLFTRYSSVLRAESLLDFDQMAELVLRLLKTHPQVLSKLQSRYVYVLVDEFQDTNSFQYEVLKMITSRAKNLFVVGDDDQAIYSFRGSSPGIMKKFQEDYASLRIYYLSINYRSAKEIVKDAGRLISDNKERLNKEIKAYSKEQGEVLYKGFETAKEEYAHIAERLRELSRQYPWSGMAVIGRTNRQLEQIRGVLERAGIPFLEEGKKDMNLQGIEKTLLDIVGYILGENRGANIWRNIVIKKGQEATFWTDKPPRLFLNYLIHGTKYMEYIRKLESEDVIKSKMELLLKESVEFKTLQAFSIHLKSKKRKRTTLEGVHLLTMHGAKGLEFDYVALIDINEGIIPGKACANTLDIEEERRMLYVGMTRAKKTLDICYLKGTREHPRFVSRFLNPLLAEREI